MNFVDEEDGWLTGVLEAIGCGSEHTTHVGHVGFNPAEPLEFTGGLARNKLGKRSLAGARRPIKNQGLNAIRLDGAPEQLARRKDMGLTDKFVQRTRPHSCRQ